MWYLWAWFCGGAGSAELMVSVDALRGLFQAK